uniref:Uncharacterized protein n=1 Tax=Dulem virus 42 TaxID=3145760 RepID=A0AAU8BBH6_9CAUD
MLYNSYTLLKLPLVDLLHHWNVKCRIILTYACNRYQTLTSSLT